MRKLSRLLVLLAALAAPAHAQGTYINVGDLPVPSTGSTSLSKGDTVVADRNGVTYGLFYSPAASLTGGTNITITSNAISVVPSPTFTTEIINANASTLPLPQTGTILLGGNIDAAASRIQLDAFGASAYFTAQRADGTNASPTTLQSGDEIGGFNAWGYNTAAYVGPKASFRAYAAQNWTTTANGTYADIATTADGGTTLTERLYIDPSGTVGIGTNSPGAQLDVRGLIAGNGLISNGTTFSVASGCGTVGSVTGGATTGSFTAGATSCAPVINLPTAPNGWFCNFHDITHPADAFTQTATATTSCTGSATVSSGDRIVFDAKGF